MTNETDGMVGELQNIAETEQVRIPEHQPVRSFRVYRYVFVLLIAWTILISGLLLWWLNHEYDMTLEMARYHARTGIEKDMLYRLWNAGHGGLYAEVTGQTQPNQYLDHPERDIVTSSGRRLTMLNPSYMTRQVHELAKKINGLEGHITSLNPIRPENAPDPWETQALELFEQGEAEQDCIEYHAEQPYVRVIQPLYVKQGCLKCHAKQGYQLGDIRGGLSISVPLNPLLAAGYGNKLAVSITTVSLWITGIGLILLWFHFLKMRFKTIQEREHALAEHDKKFRLIFENSGNSFLWVDPKTRRIINCNKSAETIFGATRDQIIGSQVLDWHLPSEAEHHRNIFKSILASKNGKTFETTIHAKDGRVVPVEISSSMTQIEGKPLIHSVVRDITERKSVEMELIDAIARAEAANTSKSQFLANMSHEIRTPMTAILGFTELLMEVDGKLPGDRKVQLDSLKTIRRNGDHLLSIINDILDLSRIEAGKLTVENQPFVLRDVLEDIKQLMQIRADAKGLELQFKYPDNLPAMVSTDPMRLRQILINLIGNAIKFTDNGTVKGELSCIELNNQYRLTIDITDTGIGMTSDQVDKLFEPFIQGDNSVSRIYGGTGLGLSISERLATMLGGSLKVVDSKPAHGTTMRLEIPAEHVDPQLLNELQPNTQQTTTTSSETLDDFSQNNDQASILVVEDGPDNQRLIEHILTKAGYRVDLVGNGQLAVDAVLKAERNNNPYHLILMDIQMPVMDGYHATKTLRHNDYQGTIIALTAHAMSGEKQKCIDAGCDDYASKPIDRKKLLDMIHSHLVNHKLHAA